MPRPVYVTGNQKKAEYLARLLGFRLEHQKLELDELQSVRLEEVVEHKARQAYALLGQPVLVEDSSLGFSALGGLPGPFIKFFVDTAGLEAVCRMLDGFVDRSAVASAVYGYYDGVTLELLRGDLPGVIAQHPTEAGWDWDRIFCPEGYGGKTRGQLTPEQDDQTYTTIKPIAALRDFLEMVHAND